ncbi:MFS transporter [Priestia koreensis]|uniref:MFS transporter n=1 Tax=Priestia koreensis TaxID=284581 RepID=UPI00203B7306|nr:MFS transporter [Priestia koreensis]MCM3003515.1 MFS transporter [Priestia koreensis]
MNEAVIQPAPTEMKRPLLLQKDFLIIFAITLSSRLGFSLFLFTQSWFVINELHQKAGLGMIFIASSVPAILLMTLGGVLADRFNRKTIVLLSTLAEALTIGSVFLLLFNGWNHLSLFIVSALLFGIIDSFHVPARNALLPSVVQEDDLMRANSLISIISQVTGIFGAFLAGVFIKYLDYSTIFLLASLIMIFFSACIPFLSLKKEKVEKEDQEPLLQSFKNGLSYIRKNTFLSTLISVSFVINVFITGPMALGIPLIASKLFKQNSLAFSTMEAVLVVGILAGSAAVGMLNFKKNRGLIAMWALFALGLTYLGLGVSRSLVMCLIFLFLLGFALSFSNAPIFAIVQSKVENAMLGRVMSVMMLAGSALQPVSYGLTSLLLGTGIDIQTVIVLGAVPLTCVILWIFLKVPVLRQTN